MRKVALDLGRRKIALCEIRDGQVAVRRTVQRLSSLRRELGPGTPVATVALEACREVWHVHDVLADWGHQPVVVDTTRVRQLGIGQHGRKTDRIDAETLARALEAGRLPVAHVLSAHRRQLRELLCVRRQLVSTHAAYIAQIRELLRARGVTMPGCAAEVFARRLKEIELEPDLRELVRPLETLLVPLGQQIAGVEEQLHQLCEQEPVITRLATVPGVALLVAAAFVSVIDDAHRFRRASHVASYLGLVPTERSSSDRRRLGAISKKGNSYLRSLLVQSAWCVMRSRSSDPLTEWAHQVAERRGKRVAVVAVARRLARLMWALWRDEQVYDPLLLADRSARGLDKQAEQTQRHSRALRQATRKLERQRRQAHRRTEDLGAMEVTG